MQGRAGMCREMWEYWGFTGDFVWVKEPLDGRNRQSDRIKEGRGGKVKGDPVFVGELIREKRICRNQTVTPLLSRESNGEKRGEEKETQRNERGTQSGRQRQRRKNLCKVLIVVSDWTGRPKAKATRLLNSRTADLAEIYQQINVDEPKISFLLFYQLNKYFCCCCRIREGTLLR